MSFHAGAGEVLAGVVSVVIPAYNSEPYLSECLDSVCSQSYKDLDIILINDGSSDATLDIMLRYERLDHRVRVISEENSGVSSSRNKGISLARGEFIVFVDSDDVVSADFVSALVSQMSCDDIGCAAVGIDYFSSERTGEFGDERPVLFDSGELVDNLFEPIGGFMANKMYRLNIIRANHLRLDESVSVSEDLLFNSFYFKQTEKVSFNRGTKYLYRKYSQSAVNRMDNIKWFDSLIVYRALHDAIRDPDNCVEYQFRIRMLLFEAEYRLKSISGDKRLIKHEMDCLKQDCCNPNAHLGLKHCVQLAIFMMFPGATMRYLKRSAD